MSIVRAGLVRAGIVKPSLIYQGIINAMLGSDDPVFHAATYDPITFELQQELVGVGGETCTHTSTIYAPDYLGVYHAFGADEPVWEGGRVELDPDQLFATFTATQTPSNNLRMTFNDGSTWGVNYGGRIENGLVSGVSQNGKEIGVGDELRFYGGDNPALTVFYCYTNNLTGNIPNLSANTALTVFYCYTNNLTGNIPNLSANTALTKFNCATNNLTGSIPDLSANTALTQFHCTTNNLTGNIPNLSANTALTQFHCATNNLTGNIPDLSANTALSIFHCTTNNLTGYLGGWPATAFVFNASTNALTEAAVNLILTEADTYGIAAGTTIDLRWGTNAAPTGAGITAKNNLIANGATVSTN